MNPNGEAPNVVSYKKTANSEDPLVNFQINNPIPPLKRLLKKLFSNEEITIRIPIITAIAIVAFGLGGASGFLTAIKTHLAQSVPIVNEIFPTPLPVITPDPWPFTTLFGTLSKPINDNLYLVLESGDVVLLVTPSNVNLLKLSGKKIIASGKYNKDEKTMQVSVADDLILFSSTAPVPTTNPTEKPEATNIPSSTPEATPIVTF